jgi:hypothetical protein
MRRELQLMPVKTKTTMAIVNKEGLNISMNVKAERVNSEKKIGAIIKNKI